MDAPEWPPEYTVRQGLWDDNTKVATVQRTRHTCQFREDANSEWMPETKLTYCNNCGSLFTWGGSNNVCAECEYPGDK